MLSNALNIMETGKDLSLERGGKGSNGAIRNKRDHKEITEMLKDFF